jgi:hypothetical protein
MLLLLELLKLGRIPDLNLLLPILNDLPQNEPLLRPLIITSLGYSDQPELLLDLPDNIALTALGIAGNIEVLESKLDANGLDQDTIISILDGFSYQKYIPSNIDDFTGSDNLSIKLQALKLLALNGKGKDLVDKQYESGKGRNAILEMYRFYGPSALELYERTATAQQKVVRQTTVTSLMSDEMLQYHEIHPRIRSILETVDRTDTIWHIRRDARIGIDYIGSAD